LPYPADMSSWCPYIKFCDFDAPWSDNAISTTTMLIPLQIQYNSVRSQIGRNIKMHGNIKLVAPDNSIRRIVTNDSMDIMTYGHQYGAPKIMSPPPLAGYILQEPANIVREFEDISNQSVVSKGRVPSNISSGLAIAYLTEQDDTAFGPIAADFEEGMSKWGTWVLRIIREKYVERRTLAIVGKNKIEEVMSFYGKDFKDSKDVICQPGSFLPGNRIARQEFIFRLMNSGFFQVLAQNPKLGLNIARLLEFGDIESLYEQSTADIEIAQEENIRMSKAEQVIFSVYDDHLVHKEIHEGFIKSKDGRVLVYQNPQILQLFETHLAQHDQALYAGAMQQGQLASPMTGAQGFGEGGVGSLGPSGANQMSPETPGIDQVVGLPEGYPNPGAAGAGMGISPEMIQQISNL